VVVSIAGEAHMDLAQGLGERLRGLMTEDTREMIIDLSGLAFMSTVALGAIVAAYLSCKKREAGFKLVAPRPDVMNVLKVTKLTKLMPVYATADAARPES
jgi:anti-sigma B factor antagonist